MSMTQRGNNNQVRSFFSPTIDEQNLALAYRLGVIKSMFEYLELVRQAREKGRRV